MRKLSGGTGSFEDGTMEERAHDPERKNWGECLQVNRHGKLGLSQQYGGREEGQGKGEEAEGEWLRVERGQGGGKEKEKEQGGWRRMEREE